MSCVVFIERHLLKVSLFKIYRPKFGKLLRITGDQFLEVIDGEKPDVTIIIHLFDEVGFLCSVSPRCIKSCTILIGCT